MPLGEGILFILDQLGSEVSTLRVQNQSLQSLNQSLQEEIEELRGRVTLYTSNNISTNI